jgi:hypothetical protein
VRGVQPLSALSVSAPGHMVYVLRGTYALNSDANQSLALSKPPPHAGSSSPLDQTISAPLVSPKVRPFHNPLAVEERPCRTAVCSAMRDRARGASTLQLKGTMEWQSG